MGKKDINVNQIADEWLEKNKVIWKQSTYSKYYHIVHDIVAVTLPSTTILKVSENLVQAEVNKMCLQNRSVSYTRDYVMIINALLRYAKSKGFACQDNLHILFPKKKKAQMPYLSNEEERHFVRFLMKKPDSIKIGILFSLFTGIRCGELCALQWSDIDLNKKTVVISKTLQRIQQHNIESRKKTKVVIMPPKSENSFRIIPIPDCMIKVLKKNRPQCDDAYFLSGLPNKYIEPRCLQNRFKRYIDECGLPSINFHALRHTFATRCIEVGFDAKSLSEILGHADVKTTLNLYVHSSFETKVENMNKLNSIAD